MAEENLIVRGAREHNLQNVAGLAKPGDRVVVTAGLPMHQPGTKNLLRVEVV